MNSGLDVVGVLLMAAISFPLSFLIARACLRGVLRVLAAPEERTPHPAR